MRKFVFLLVIGGGGVWGQKTLDATLENLDKVKTLGETAISPDGKTVAWTEAANGDPQTARMLIRPLGEGRERTVSLAGAREAAWAPDSARVAFLAPEAGSADARQLQLWTMAVSGKGAFKAHRLTSLKGFLARPEWAPDGRGIAMLFTENAPRAAGPLEAETPPAGVIDDAIFLQKLVVIDAASGKMRTVSPDGLYIYEYDWAPDSAHFVYTAAPGPGDDNWWTAKLYTLDVASGAVKTVHETRMQMAGPRWSPDGSTIAFIEGIMSDEGATGGDIYTVAAAGGEAVDRTPGRKASPSWLSWLPSSKRILFAETVGGSTAVSTLDLASGTTETNWKGDESVHAGGEEISLSKDGTEAAAVRSSWTMAPEVWAGPVGRWTQVSHANAGMKPAWGEAKSVTWKSGDFEVQGWLVLPAGFEAGTKKYPMVVSVHGGPASARKPSWPRAFFDLTLLSNEGYFVFFPNPRGSYGQGEAFTAANVKDFGGGDLKDILAGVDAVTAEYPVDSQRVGIAGWSYGGYMTMWAVTQTQRFRAAVAGAGLANWQSYYGQNSIDQWMIPYFGATVYDDPAVYAKSAPIDFVKNVKTPTLVVVGDSDGECPAPQSFEYWHALKSLGVKTRLVVYAGEGHRFHKPEDMRDVMARTVAWFGENMK